MADCTQTLLQKASYRMILGWWRNQAPAFSQALLILLSHLQSHVRTPPTMEKRRGRKKEPGQSVWIGTSSLAASDADRAVTSDLCPTPLTKFAQLISAAWHWWTFDLMMSVPHTQHNHDCQPESLTETRHMHTHTQSREAGVWMQYTNIITLLCLLWRTMAAGSWHSNAQGKPFPG